MWCCSISIEGLLAPSIPLRPPFSFSRPPRLVLKGPSAFVEGGQRRYISRRMFYHDNKPYNCPAIQAYQEGSEIPIPCELSSGISQDGDEVHDRYGISFLAYHKIDNSSAAVV